MGLKPHEIAMLGVGRTFQFTRLFENVTVIENVMAGQHRLMRSGISSAIFRSSRHKREENEGFRASLEKLSFVGLESIASELVANIPFGQKRLVEIARALALEPDLLLMDEPVSGLSSKEAEQMLEMIRQIRNRNVSVLFVDHHMNFVMEISDEIVVLDQGSKIAEGRPEDIQKEETVVTAYLGRRGGSLAENGKN